MFWFWGIVLGGANRVHLPSWEVLGHFMLMCPWWLGGIWCLLPEGTQYRRWAVEQVKYSVFHLFQVVSVPFAVLRTFGGVSNCAITGFGGYLIILGSPWFGKAGAVGNYQFLLVDSLNSFCHAVLHYIMQQAKTSPLSSQELLWVLPWLCWHVVLLGGSKKGKKW